MNTNAYPEAGEFRRDVFRDAEDTPVSLSAWLESLRCWRAKGGEQRRKFSAAPSVEDDVAWLRRHVFLWYPSVDEWHSVAECPSEPGDLVDEWFACLGNWRSYLDEEQGVVPELPKPTQENDLAWLRERVLASPPELLPDPEVVTVEALLKKCEDLEMRAELGYQLRCVDKGVLMMHLERSDEGDEYLWVDDQYRPDCSPGDAWPWDESETILILGAPDYAERMTAWLSFDWGVWQRNYRTKGKLCVWWLKDGVGALDPEHLEANHLNDVATTKYTDLQDDQDWLEHQSGGAMSPRIRKRLSEIEALENKADELRERRRDDDGTTSQGELPDVR